MVDGKDLDLYGEESTTFVAFQFTTNGTGDEWFVFDVLGNRIGLSLIVNGRPYVLNVSEPPWGATSRAWDGVYTGVRNGQQ